MPQPTLSMVSDFAHSELPLPLRIAKQWNFQLAYVETSDGMFYAVQDWIRGLTGVKDVRKQWSDMNCDHPEFRDLVVRYPYISTHGKKYLVAHSTQENLLTITRFMNGFRHTTWEKLLALDHRTNNEYAYLYIVGLMRIAGYYKIGIAKNLEHRLGQLRTDNPFEPFYRYTIELENYRVIESKLHSIFKDKNIYGEWFLLSEDDLVNIQTFLESQLK